MRPQAIIVDPWQVAKVRLAIILGVHPEDVSDRTVERMAELVAPADDTNLGELTEEVVGWIE